MPLIHPSKGLVFDPAELKPLQDKNLRTLEGRCEPKKQNNTFPGWVWSPVDVDGIKFDGSLRHSNIIPGCGKDNFYNYLYICLLQYTMTYE